MLGGSRKSIRLHRLLLLLHSQSFQWFVLKEVKRLMLFQYLENIWFCNRYFGSVVGCVFNEMISCKNKLRAVNIALPWYHWRGFSMRHAESCKKKVSKNLSLSKICTGRLLQMCESSNVLAMLRWFSLECSVVFKSIGLETCFLCKVKRDFINNSNNSKDVGI